MTFEQILKLQDYLRPPRFDAEFLDTRVLKEWTHWKKCFEYFLNIISQQHISDGYTMETDDKYYILINHLSPRVYDHIKDISDYKTALNKLEKAIRSNQPNADAAFNLSMIAPEILDKSKSSSTTQKYLLTDVTQLANILFEDVRVGKLEVIDKIGSLKEDKLKNILEARNRRHKTLLQEAIINRREQVADELLNIISFVCVEKLSQHGEHKSELIAAGETFIHNAIPKLSDFLTNPQSHNRAPITVITYAHIFVTEYKKYLSGKVIDRDVVTVDALLEALEFDERCRKFSTYDQGRGLLYYELTNNVKESDVNFIMDLFESNAIAPVKRFVDRLKKS